MRLLPITNHTNRNKGFITGEFIFSMVLAAGISAVLFAVTYTLSVIEITQYISFTSARAMISSNATVEDQVQAAQDKYKSIINQKALKGLFFGDGSLFALSSDPDVRVGGASDKDFSESYRDGQSNTDRVAFTGVRAELTPKIMNLKIAFLGSTSETGEASEFATRLTTILTRESSAKECMDLYVNRRYEAIGIMTDRFKQYGTQGATDYVPLEDNGC